MPDLFKHPPHHFQAWENPEFRKAGIGVSILRGDLFHPWIQGNKWYKLRHFAALAEKKGFSGFVSVGGAWSNHLLALACYAAEKKMQAHFFIRGAEIEWRNHLPVLQMKKSGAILHEISRSDYRMITQGKSTLKEFATEHYDLLEVPTGASAAEVIPETAAWAEYLRTQTKFTDLVLPVASGGTIAGMLAGLPEDVRVHGIDVLNSKNGLVSTIYEFLQKAGLSRRATLRWHDAYHFGAYARNHPDLDQFIKNLKEVHQVPSEHVYSGKAFYAVSDLAAKGHFSEGCKILVLHTGGLFQWK